MKTTMFTLRNAPERRTLAGIALPLGFLLLPVLPANAEVRARIGSEKKLIEWGWDEPTPAYLRANAQRMDGYGFDGVIFHADPVHEGKAANFAWECWSAKRFAYADFAQNLADLRAAQATFTRMTDNFLRFNVCPGDVDWFDDAAFAGVVNNARLAGRVAHEGGCKGLMFDIEMYGKPLFTYDKQAHKEAKSFAEYEAQVRRRGRELMRAFNQWYPDITVLLTYGYGITGVGGDRSKAQYGLLKNLFDGMFEAARKGATLVDAYEGAYSFRTRKEFVAARKTVLGGLISRVGAPDAYRKHVRLGFGVWMDNRYGAKAWNTDDFEKNYFTPAEFEYSLFCGLSVCDKYVWVYTEHPKWWTNEKLPAEYLNAIRHARNPRVLDDAKHQGRQVKDPPTDRGPVASAQPGYDDEATFGDLKAKFDFVADLPKTWKFCTDPEREGVQGEWFSPALDLADWRDMLIGKFWDEQGVRYQGDAWYRLTWGVPALELPANARLYLWFGAVDEQATVWVNGAKVGVHTEPPDLGWDKRFSAEVTGRLRPGEQNTIAVQVNNAALAGGIWKSVKLAVGGE
ncbi:MAG: hypothetical protein COY42_15130 [Armatimonadetes bacterium CG_4_10_14_0_8_um_filter_66_14]|nr:hypothetical protein [Armatimonadota bacterium]NCO95909.1 hypothetical protein [Armatimonadota bacterium]NCP29920.1 hypothetical protein [Armatimonadota bacterium]PIX43854.1 MAG: hypothetical protein COZ57_18465 [Armatimonadetes bacterium CG_4_8_14_3_um_filter_66_20]PIZ43852.1 MAG: hypothetical protein COY42_15130 [Armatimonadetes bacterium CG_4_10_14_0_8_um_filter_66_14]